MDQVSVCFTHLDDNQCPCASFAHTENHHQWLPACRATRWQHLQEPVAYPIRQRLIDNGQHALSCFRRKKKLSIMSPDHLKRSAGGLPCGKSSRRPFLTEEFETTGGQQKRLPGRRSCQMPWSQTSADELARFCVAACIFYQKAMYFSSSIR